MANTRSIIGDQTALDGLVSGSLESFEDDGINTIRSYAFYYSPIKRVRLPNLMSIPDYCFGYSGIEEISADDFPNVESVGSSSFNKAGSLTSVIFEKCKSFGTYTFQDCTNLETARFPGLTGNTYWIVEGCRKLTHFLIGKQSVPSGYPANNSLINAKMGAVYVPSGSVQRYRASDNYGRYIIKTLEEYPASRFETISDTWAEIDANADYATDYKIGDIKCVEYNGDLYPMELIAINIDEKQDGSTAKMTWMIYNCIESYAFDSVNTGHNWEDSALRAHLANDILPNLDASAYIKPVKKTFYDYSTQATKTCIDSLWIPSARELNDTTYEDSGCIYDSRFPYPTKRSPRYKGTDSVDYTLRSDSKSESGKTVGVSYQNGSYFDTASKTATYRIMFGFCI